MTKLSLQVPSFGWKAKLDFKFPSKRTPNRYYSFGEILSSFMLGVRYLIYYIKLWWHGKTPVMDFFKLAQCDQQSGVPLGGIGGGTIGRGFRGEFSRFSMIPGLYEYPSTTVEAAQFILNVQDSSGKTMYQKVLSCQRKPSEKLTSWDWDFPGTEAEYVALYPRSWTVFNIPELEMKLVVRQISPVIPHNYKDSCIPGGVFVWTAYNFSNAPKKVSIVFTFESGIGWTKDISEKYEIKTFDNSSDKNSIAGVLMSQEVRGHPLTYGLATLKEKEDVSYITFDPSTNGDLLWSKLKKDGKLEPLSTPSSSLNYSGSKKMASGLCNGATVESNDSKSLVFSLTWDNPVFKYGEANTSCKRYYTKYFGDSGHAAPDLCLYCIENYRDWESSIETWQSSVLENKNLPDWYKSALFNELYFVSDGGTVWTLVENKILPDNDPRKEYGRFSYLEGHEYRMVNTYDVHFYSSVSLIMLWPKLQISLQYDFRDAIMSEDKTPVWHLYNGGYSYRKVKNTVPHDLGDPEEDPYNLVNIYNVHDISDWKDLNLKFILQVYRDYVLTNDVDYVKDMFADSLVAMNHALTWGTDEDGMIKNSGFPDQTYDVWVMTGVSAYCGGLWVAALIVFIKLAKLVDEPEIANKFSAILSKAKKTYEKELWTGEYYRFDNGGTAYSEGIMTDMLCGLWYLRCSGVTDEVLPPAHVQSALRSIYRMNVKSYYSGSQGAVNGIMPDGKVIKTIQSEEVWPGVTYAYASLLIYEGLWDEAFSTVEGMYKTIYEKSGLGFATPEALIGTDTFRAISYMRPLSIWSMQLAIEAKSKSS